MTTPYRVPGQVDNVERPRPIWERAIRWFRWRLFLYRRSRGGLGANEVGARVIQHRGVWMCKECSLWYATCREAYWCSNVDRSDCELGNHVVRVVRVLKGGEGPDEAADEIECAHGCGASGYRFCDGTLSWHEHEIGTGHLMMRWVRPGQKPGEARRLG